MWTSLLLLQATADLLLANPDYNTPIDIAKVHLNEVSTYTFHLKGTLVIPRYYEMRIDFPDEFEATGTSPITVTGCTVSTSVTSSTCTTSVTADLVMFTFPFEITAGTAFDIVLSGITNPLAQRLIEPFDLMIRKPDDIGDYMRNKIYMTFAFDNRLSPTQTIVAQQDLTYTGYTGVVDELSTYAIKLSMPRNIDRGTWFQLQLPTDWSVSWASNSNCKIEKTVVSDTDPTGTYSCTASGQYLTLKGLSQNIIRANYNSFSILLVFPSIKNPPFIKTTGSNVFYLYVLEQETNRVLSYHSMSSPQITQGTISQLTLAPVNSYNHIFNSNNVRSLFTIQPSHQLKEGGTIVITLTNAVFITSSHILCIVKSGLSNHSGGTYPQCNLTSTAITLSAYGNTNAMTSFTVEALIRVSASNTSDTVQVQTFNSGFLCDSSSFTVLTVESGFTLFTSLTIAQDTGIETTDTGNVVITLRPTASMAVGSVVTLYYQADFTFGAISCQQATPASGGSSAMTSCSNQDSTIVGSASAVFDNTQDTKFTLGSLNYPYTQSNPDNVYEFCVRVANVGGSVNYFGCSVINLAPIQLSVTNALTTIGDANNVVVPFTLTIQSPANVSATQARIGLELQTANAGGQQGFYNDFGVSDSDMNCKFSSEFGAAGTCTRTSTNASTSTDFVLVQFDNFNVLPSTASTIKFVAKTPVTASTNFTYKIWLAYIEKDIVKVVARHDTLTFASSSVKPSWGVLAINPRSELTINTSTQINVTASAQAASPGTGPFYTLYIVFPAGWVLTTVTNFTINAIDFSSVEVLQNTYYPTIVAQTSDTALFTALQDVIIISPITNPKPVTTGTGSPLILGLANNSAVMQHYGQTTGTNTANLAQSKPAVFPEYSLTVNDRETQFPGVIYTFSATLVNDIPLNGKLKLTFPAEYTDFSRMECEVIINNLKSQVPCTETGNVVSLTSFSNPALTDIAVAATSQITGIIKYIENSSRTLVTGFAITTTDSSDLIYDQKTDITLLLDDPFTKGSLRITDIKLDPPNKRAQNADFFLSFITAHFIPKSTVFTLSVPTNFARLNSSTCYFSKAVSACSISEWSFSITTAEDIDKDTELTVSANGLFTVPNINVTDAFQLTAIYNSIVLDDNSSSPQSQNKFYPQPEIGTLTLDEIYFYPKNQGEPATYRFSIRSDEEIESSSTFIIWFPNNFDDTLTELQDDIRCWGEPQELVGATLECKVSEFRKLRISGHNDLRPNIPIFIYIGGIRNPKGGKLGSFRVGIENEDMEIDRYLVKAGNFWTTSTPNILRVREFTVTNQYARISNTINLQISLTTDLPSNQDRGSIWIDFPNEFALKNLGSSRGWEYPCTADTFIDYSVQSTKWNDNPKCINYSNNRIVITGGKFVQASTGTFLSITIQNVPGPKFTTQTSPFRILTYDGYNNKILDRTYYLLNYPLTFTLPLLGENIIVNNSADIIVRKGSGSGLIPLATQTQDSPMRTIIQLTAQIPRLEEAVFYPNSLIVWDVSDYQTFFRVGVPYNTTPGAYTIEWSKTGDDYSASVVGDEIYTDIGYTTIRVVNEKSDITMSRLSQVGAPGRAFPIEFTLEYPPHLNLNITPYVESGLSNSGIVFEPESLIFNTGETSKILIIRATSQAQFAKYNVRFELGGIDSEAYASLDDIVLDLVGDSSLAPGISEITYVPDRLFSTFTATVTKASTIFYQVALENTPLPTPNELVNAFSEGKADYVNIFSPAAPIEFTVNELAAETKYILYATAEDIRGNKSVVYQLPFTTANDYESVKFAIDFNANQISNNETNIDSVMVPELAKALSVLPDRIKAYTLQSTQARRLQENAIDTSGLSQYAAIVELGNDKYNNMNSPLISVQNLTLNALNKYMNKVNLTAIQITSPFSMANVVPNWTKIGNVWTVTSTSITGVGKIDGEGHLHMTIQDRGKTEPTPQQIVWGLDGDNQPTRHISAFYDGVSDYVTVTYNGLVEEQKYDVYLAITNDYPGNTKAVNSVHYAYKGVRTDSSCEICDKYLVVDDDEAASWIYILGIWLILV